MIIRQIMPLPQGLEPFCIVGVATNLPDPGLECVIGLALVEDIDRSTSVEYITMRQSDRQLRIATGYFLPED